MVNIYYLISLFYAKGCGTWGEVLALISSFQLCGLQSCLSSRFLYFPRVYIFLLVICCFYNDHIRGCI